MGIYLPVRRNGFVGTRRELKVFWVISDFKPESVYRQP